MTLLRQLADTAVYHAQQLLPNTAELNMAVVDEILDLVRDSDPTHGLAPLEQCYGAWFGEFLVEKLDGRWIGLEEPVAPRIECDVGRYSPMDAVGRRLRSETSPSLESLWQALESANVASREKYDWERRNVDAWTVLAGQNHFVTWDIPADSEVALAGLDPWLREEGVRGKRILCLAAGGGTHGPLLSRCGANVCVVDNCQAALEVDRDVMKRHGLSYEALNRSMLELVGIEDSSFDIVVQPVSLSYLPIFASCYQEVARVLKEGGLYVSQQKYCWSLVLEADANERAYRLPSENKAACEGPVEPGQNRESGTVEYLHRPADLIGQLCRSGFVIEDMLDPVREDGWASFGTAAHRAGLMPAYFKIKARRMSRQD